MKSLLHISTDGDPEELTVPDSHLCPFIGMQLDPDTNFAFPNSLNCCHRARSPQPVLLEYQASTCLTAVYRQCPVFGSNPGEVTWKVPAAGKHPAVDRHSLLHHRVVEIWAALVVTLCALVLFGFFTGRFNHPGVYPVLADIDVPTASSTLPYLAPTEKVAALPTATLLPASPSPGPEIGTPFGPGRGNQGGFLLHLVKPGESIDSLAQAYHTTVAVLAAANQSVDAYRRAEAALAAAQVRMPSARLAPGCLLVVLPWQTDPQGVPRFQVVQLGKETDLHDLAKHFGVPVADLRLYNGLGGSDFIPPGRWLIIPIN